MKRKGLTIILLLLPTMSILLATTIYPLTYSIYLSLGEWRLTFPKPYTFIGMNNFINAFMDIFFLASIARTGYYVGFSVLIECVLGLALALTLQGTGTWKKIFKSIFIIPIALTPVGVGYIFRFMYQADFGVINYLLSCVGISGKKWLADPVLAMFALCSLDIWQWTPFIFLCLLAGIESLPPELDEAAQIDGASKWQLLRYITLPQLKLLIMIVLFIRILWIMKGYAPVRALTEGGPGQHTAVLTFKIFNQAFLYYNTSYAAAQSLIMLGVMLAIGMVIISKYKKYMEEK